MLFFYCFVMIKYDICHNGIDLTERKSINFTNIKFNTKKKSKSPKKKITKEEVLKESESEKELEKKEENDNEVAKQCNKNN